MVKVRCLQSIILTGEDKVLGFNDEVELDKKLAERLFEKGLVDILKEEKPKPAPKRTVKKKAEPVTEPVKDVKGQE